MRVALGQAYEKTVIKSPENSLTKGTFHFCKKQVFLQVCILMFIVYCSFLGYFFTCRFLLYSLMDEREVVVLCYWNCHIKHGPDGVYYEGSTPKEIRVKKKTDFGRFLDELYLITGFDKQKSKLEIVARYPVVQSPNKFRYLLHPVMSDASLEKCLRFQAITLVLTLSNFTWKLNQLLMILLLLLQWELIPRKDRRAHNKWWGKDRRAHNNKRWGIQIQVQDQHRVLCLVCGLAMIQCVWDCFLKI